MCDAELRAGFKIVTVRFPSGQFTAAAAPVRVMETHAAHYWQLLLSDTTIVSHTAKQIYFYKITKNI